MKTARGGFSCSINKKHAVFNLALNQVMVDGYRLKNPAKGVKSPKKNIEKRTISDSYSKSD